MKREKVFCFLDSNDLSSAGRVGVVFIDTTNLNIMMHPLYNPRVTERLEIESCPALQSDSKADYLSRRTESYG